MGGLLQEALPVSTLVVAIDPGKVAHRVWLSTGERGQVVEPRTLSVLRAGLDELDGLVRAQRAPMVVFAIEATGGLHQAWVYELARRFPGSVRLFAPSETTAARACVTRAEKHEAPGRERRAGAKGGAAPAS